MMKFQKIDHLESPSVDSTESRPSPLLSLTLFPNLTLDQVFNDFHEALTWCNLHLEGFISGLQQCYNTWSTEKFYRGARLTSPSIKSVPCIQMQSAIFSGELLLVN